MPLTPQPRRPDEGEKCGTCGCYNRCQFHGKVDSHGDHLCLEGDDEVCHGHPAAPEGKELPGMKVCQQHGYHKDTCPCKSLPVADAGGWIEKRIDRNLNSFRALPLTPEIRDEDMAQLKKWMLDDVEDIRKRERNALIDEAVREVEKRLLANLDFVNDHDEVTWRAATKAAIAALIKLKERA